MQSRGMVLASTALGAALAFVFGGCGQGHRSHGSPLGGEAQGATGSDGPLPHPVNCPVEGEINFFPGGNDGQGHMGEFAPRLAGWFGPPFALTGASDCATPNPVSTVVDQGRDIHYQFFYPFENFEDVDVCIAVTARFLPVNGPDNGEFEVAAYVGRFDPSDFQKNAVAVAKVVDTTEFRFDVPPHTGVEIVAIGAQLIPSDGSTAPPLDFFYEILTDKCGEGSSSDGGSSSGGSSSGGGGGGDDGGTGGKSW